MPGKGARDGGGLSQEQMLWVVLALLCTAVVCFAAGILVNKIQSRPEVTKSTEAGQVERLPSTKESPAREAAKVDRDTKPAGMKTEGVQVSPAPVVLPGESRDAAPPSRSVTQRDQNTQFVPAPPPQRDDKEAAPKAESSPAPAPPPAQEQPAAPTPPADVPAPAQTVTQTTTPREPEPVAPVSAPATLDAPKTGFTIQVGSFDTMANAEKFKKAIEHKSDYEVTLYPTKDGKVVKACVGKFETKEAAAKEREQLDRIKDFKGCFVKPLSEL